MSKVVAMSKVSVEVVAGTEYPGPVFYKIKHVRDGRYERGANVVGGW